MRICEQCTTAPYALKLFVFGHFGLSFQFDGIQMGICLVGKNGPRKTVGSHWTLALFMCVRLIPAHIQNRNVMLEWTLHKRRQVEPWKGRKKKRPETRKKCVFACKSAEERHMFPFKFAVCVLSCKCCIVGFSFSFRLNWIFAGCKVDICLFVDLHCIHKYLNVCLTVCNDVCVLFSVTIFLPGFFFWSRDARFHFIYGKTHTFFVYNFVYVHVFSVLWSKLHFLFALHTICLFHWVKITRKSHKFSFTQCNYVEPQELLILSRCIML